MTRKLACSIDGCGKPVKAHGWCGTHYARYLRHGSPDTLRRPPNGSAQRFLTDVASGDTGDDCLIWPYSHKGNGYGQIRRDGKTMFAHRLVCEAAHGPPPTQRHEAAHSCGNGHRGCVNPRHLSWKTPAENSADRVSHGVHNKGSHNAGAKLTEADVVKIMALNGRIRQLDVARFFGVSPSTIRRIWLGLGWGHVNG